MRAVRNRPAALRAVCAVNQTGLHHFCQHRTANVVTRIYGVQDSAITGLVCRLMIDLPLGIRFIPGSPPARRLGTAALVQLEPD
jgi:hypothetical protein